MRRYIFVLIILFSFILLSHLLNVQEGLACLNNEAMASFNKNANTITEYQTQIDLLTTEVESAENSVKQNSLMMAKNEDHNNQMKTAVCPDECPSIHHGDGGGKIGHTYDCAVGCCDLEEHALGDDCVNPWNTEKTDSKSDTAAESGIPPTAALAKGISPGPPSKVALSAI